MHPPVLLYLLVNWAQPCTKCVTWDWCNQHEYCKFLMLCPPPANTFLHFSPQFFRSTRLTTVYAYITLLCTCCTITSYVSATWHSNTVNPKNQKINILGPFTNSMAAKFSHYMVIKYWSKAPSPLYFQSSDHVIMTLWFVVLGIECVWWGNRAKRTTI